MIRLANTMLLHRRSFQRMMDQDRENRRPYSTKEIVVADNNMDKDTGVEPTRLGQGPASVEPFRLMDLPPELRCHIYSFVLPQDMLIIFELSGRGKDGNPIRVALGVRKGEDVALQIGGPSSYRTRDETHRLWKTVSRLKHATVETQLFRVNKLIRNEAQGELSLLAHLFLCLLF
jgi:hypothetical protein